MTTVSRCGRLGIALAAACILSIPVLAGAQERAASEASGEPQSASQGQSQSQSQSESQGDGAGKTDANGEPMEEMVVTGERSVSALMNLAGEETMKFYDLLNSVLNDPEYKIECNLEYPPGSRIATRVCRTQFARDAVSGAAQQTLRNLTTDNDGNLFMANEAIANPELTIIRKQRVFEEKILEAVNTNPELNASVRRMLALKEEIDQRRHGDD